MLYYFQFPIQVFLYVAHSQENDFELILTVKMDIRHPVKGNIGSEFRAICNNCRAMAA